MRGSRKVTPRVRDGKVQKKDRHGYTAGLGYQLDRERPDDGHIHVVSKQDIRRFTEAIPDWDEHAQGLERIKLVAKDEGADAYYQLYHREGTGSIFLCAWPADLWITVSFEYFDDHRHILKTIGVATTEVEDGMKCHFTRSQAKAFSLVHVFLHELGHHVDRMASQNQGSMPGGEHFAEKFAKDRFGVVWQRYQRLFRDA